MRRLLLGFASLLVGCSGGETVGNGASEVSDNVTSLVAVPTPSASPSVPAPAAAPADPTEYPPFTGAPASGPPGPKSYRIRGGKLDLPLGDASFADELVSFRSGVPAAREIQYRNAGLALGPPDYIGDGDDQQNGPKDMTLGCGGVMVLRFTDNVLIDVPGPDLYAFEVGPMVEPTDVAISADGETWLEAGRIEGGTSSLDIAKVAAPGASYHYVRLTDAKVECGTSFPGADIDAVAAIGAALSISLDSSVLFDVDKAELKPAASDELIRAATVLKGWSGKAVAIEGHTDATGSAAHNQALSQARATAVRDFLAKRPELSGKTVTAAGFAATRPVASNDDAAGRTKNRRVDVILSPDRGAK